MDDECADECAVHEHVGEKNLGNCVQQHMKMEKGAHGTNTYNGDTDRRVGQEIMCALDAENMRGEPISVNGHLLQAMKRKSSPLSLQKAMTPLSRHRS